MKEEKLFRVSEISKMFGVSIAAVRMQCVIDNLGTFEKNRRVLTLSEVKSLHFRRKNKTK